MLLEVRGLEVRSAAVRVADVTRVESRHTGSMLEASAWSSCNAIHKARVAPAELPLTAMRVGSMFHSFALDRTNCTAHPVVHRSGERGVGAEPVVGGDHRDARIQALLEDRPRPHTGLVAPLERATVEEDQHGRQPVRPGPPEVERVPPVRAIRNISICGRTALLLASVPSDDFAFSRVFLYSRASLRLKTPSPFASAPRNFASRCCNFGSVSGCLLWAPPRSGTRRGVPWAGRMRGSAEMETSHDGSTRCKS